MAENELTQLRSDPVEMKSTSLVSALTALALVSGCSYSVQGLRVMSFNVRQFGESKFSNVEVVNDLIQVKQSSLMRL